MQFHKVIFLIIMLNQGLSKTISVKMAENSDNCLFTANMN